MRWEGLLASPARFLLLPAWLIWRPLVALRSLAYDFGWLPVLRLPVPVIAVGNLAAGGTGKTPLTAWIVAHLHTLGRTPAVLMRGYGGDATGNDEAQLFADTPVICDPDRIRGGQQAMAAGADCLVLDDGFQHRRCARDLDVVCIDALRPFPGNVLPMGLLRESRAALRRATLLVVTRSDQIEPAQLAKLVADLGRYGRPVLRACHTPMAVTNLTAEDPLSPSAFAGKPVLLASGIGNPTAFARTALQLGWQIVGERIFADHHRYSAEEAAALTDAAQRLGATLIVTSKDAVKLRQFPLPGCRVLQVQLGFAPGDGEHLQALLHRVLAPDLRAAP